MTVTYTDSLAGVTPDRLRGFFVGWPNPPSADMHLRILQGSTHVLLARDGERVVGFITAISDGLLAAYIPLLEVLPEYRGQGIGTELVKRLLDRLGGLYMIDVICDPDVQPFYERLGLMRYTGMIRRNYDVLSRKETE